MVKSATAYNPFVYYFCSENFQATIKKAFTRKPNQPETITIEMANIPEPEAIQAPQFGEVQHHQQPLEALIPAQEPHQVGIYSEAGVNDVDQHVQPQPQQDTMAERGSDCEEVTTDTAEIEVHTVEIEVHTIMVTKD